MKKTCLRTQEIKLRLLPEEYELLKTLSIDEKPLAPILRNLLLSLAKMLPTSMQKILEESEEENLSDFLEMKKRKQQGCNKKPVPTVAPELLRALAAIGNNVNQIARSCNQSKKLNNPIDLAVVAIELGKIEAALVRIREET